MFKKLEESLSKGIFDRVNKILDRIKQMNCPRKDLVKASVEKLAKKENDETFVAFYDALFSKGVLFTKYEVRQPTNQKRTYVHIANENLVNFSIMYGIDVPTEEEVFKKYEHWYQVKNDKSQLSECEITLKKLSLNDSFKKFINLADFDCFEVVMFKIYSLDENTNKECNECSVVEENHKNEVEKSAENKSSVVEKSSKQPKEVEKKLDSKNDTVVETKKEKEFRVPKFCRAKDSVEKTDEKIEKVVKEEKKEVEKESINDNTKLLKEETNVITEEKNNSVVSSEKEKADDYVNIKIRKKDLKVFSEALKRILESFV